jgi:hypothetical protein
MANKEPWKTGKNPPAYIVRKMMAEGNNPNTMSEAQMRKHWKRLATQKKKGVISTLRKLKKKGKK